jgi:hypothetical protein
MRKLWRFFSRFLGRDSDDSRTYANPLHSHPLRITIPMIYYTKPRHVTIASVIVAASDAERVAQDRENAQ